MQRARTPGDGPYPIPPSDAEVRTNIEIPLRSGEVLRGDLYVPVGQEPPWPAIFEITPYGAQNLAAEGRTYAGRGFLFLAVDCRGRYRSEGEWEPLAHERADGHDVIAFLAGHDLCNGRIGARGQSYSGYNQLLIAVDAPPALQALCVGVAPGDPFHNAPFQGGAYDLNDLFWLFDMTGRINCGDNDDPDAPNDAHPSEETEAEDAEFDRLFDRALTTRPFRDIDLRLGLYHAHFRDWIAHWALDDYWKARSVLPHVKRINVPVLHVSGLWDGNGRGATQFYEALRDTGNAGSDAQKLLLGAWTHDFEAPDCTDLPDTETAMIDRAALRDPMNEEMAWFDRHLKDIPLGQSMVARVETYVTGAHRWAKFEDWPPPQAEETGFHLNDSSLLRAAPTKATTRSYVFDPADPTPYGPDEIDAERIPFDNAILQGERDDLLIFDSAPVTGDPLVLVGPLGARIFASADAPDFDIVVSVYDLYPDGRSIFLADGILRARFQQGFDRPQPVPAGEVKDFMIDLWHIAHAFQPGHRLRLQVASGASLRFDVNGCTGGDLATDTGMRKATITIHSGPQTPSRLIAHKLERL